MKRNEFLDYTKGLLITLVVIGHALQYVAYQGAAFWSDPLFKAIYMFHMPLFMAVSAYVAHRGVVETPTIRFIFTRAFSLLVPIIVWSTLFQLALTAMSANRHFDALSEAILHEITDSLWFLWALLGGLMLTAIAHSFGRYSLPVSIAMLFMVMLLPDSGNVYLFQYTFPFFLLGYYAAAHHLRAPSGRTLAVVTLLSGIGAAVCFVLWREPTYIYVTRMTLSPENLPNIALRFVAGGVASVFALCVLAYAFPRSGSLLRNLLITAGKGSIYIYILSGYVTLVMLAVVKRYFAPATSEWNAAVIGLTVGCAVTAFCWYAGDRLASNPVLACFLFGRAYRVVSPPRRLAAK
jgi:fucose 4-O-acetylase-like acetyltransferase